MQVAANVVAHIREPDPPSIETEYEPYINDVEVFDGPRSIWCSSSLSWGIVKHFI